MLEIEAKFRQPDAARTRAALTALGAAPAGTVGEVDHYFAAPDRDLKATDEVVRLRVSGDANTLTYKGPKRESAVKSRPEIELPVAAGPDGERRALALMTALGYKTVAVVEKRRSSFRLERGGFNCLVCLDDVAEVGRYVEIEILAPEADLTRAGDAVQALAAELNLTETEKPSYLALLLAARGRA